MNKRRIFLCAVVALAAAAALLRAHLPASSPGDPSTPPRSAGVYSELGRGAQTDKPPRLVVYVAGAVARPGVYRLAPGRVEAAIAAAGGLVAPADPVAVNLAEPLRDGEEIVVPVRGAEAAAGARSSAPCLPRRRKTARSGTRFSPPRARRSVPSETIGTVDLNRASVEELETLPGIGSHLAERIVLFRDRNGPFASLDELADVNGVSPRLLDDIGPYVSVTEGRNPAAWPPSTK